MIAAFALAHPWAYAAILAGLMMLVFWASSPSKQEDTE